MGQKDQLTQVNVEALAELIREQGRPVHINVLARALEEPFRRIVGNAGVDSPSALLAESRRQGTGVGYDALRGQLVDMAEAGILDAVGVLRLALMTAVSGAAMALSTETIVHKRRPQTSLEP